jgi:hypothetical protein
MIVLKKSFRLTDKDSDTHTNFNFTVPRDARALVVSFSYYPKKLEDKELSYRLLRKALAHYDEGVEFDDKELDSYLPLKNLLTVSVDGPQGRAGAAHRQGNVQKHVISHSGSSQGFVKQKITRGVWNITVSAHSIVTPYVDVLLEAEIE